MGPGRGGGARVAGLRGVLIDLGPLRESRDFRAVWFANLLSVVGRQAVVVAVPYQVFLVTGSSLAVGLLGIVQAVPLVVAGLYGGHFADRFDRKRVILVSQTLMAGCSAILAFGSFGLRAPLWAVYAVTAISAAVGTVEQSARSATIPRLVGMNRLPAALSLQQAMTQLAQVAGPSLAGVAIATLGLPATYLIDVACFCVAFTTITTIAAQPTLETPARLSWRAPAEGLRFVWHNQVLVGIFSADLVAMIFGMPRALFPALATQLFRVGPQGLGLLYAGPAAGALAASPFLGWVSGVRRQALTVLAAVALWGAAIAAFGFSGRLFWLALVLLAAAGAADMVSAVFRHTLVQSLSPDALRGRMSAFNSMVVTAGPRFGDLEAGGVAALTSPFFSVVSGGVLSVVGAAVLAVAMPALRRQRASALQLAEDGDVVEGREGEHQDAALDAAPDQRVNQVGPPA